MSDENDRKERLDNIRERLGSFLCSRCGGQFMLAGKRPRTPNVKECVCQSHNWSLDVPVVQDEDVEWLLGEVDRQRAENDRLRELLTAFLEAPVLAWENVGWSAESPDALRLELRDGKRLRTAEIPLAKADVITAAAKVARSGR